MINENAPLTSLSNAELLSATREIVSRSHVLEADLLVHLGEIDERRLYLDSPFPSMFAFCVDELGFSEDAAYNRITVARAGRRLPAILEALRSGSVHLAGLRLLAPHLTELNHELVLPQAAGKSKRDIEELVARLAPSPPVRTGIRRVPECAMASWSPIPGQPPPGTPFPPPTPEATSFCFAAAVQAASSAAGSSSPACGGGPTPSTCAAVAPSAIAQSQSSTEPAAAFQGGPRSVVAPLSGETFKVQFTASRELRDKLFEARALLRHRIPDGDLAKIIEKGLDLVIEKVKKERFAVGRKARTRAAAPEHSEPPSTDGSAPAAAVAATPATEEEHDTPGPAGGASEAFDTPAPSSAAAPPDEPGSRPEARPESRPDSRPERRIPDAIKRDVYERDGGRCTFVDDQGRRCASMEVEFDHRGGFARTPVHTVDGIRLLCRAHNQGAAEKMYGRDFMDRARAKPPRALDDAGRPPDNVALPPDHADSPPDNADSSPDNAGPLSDNAALPPDNAFPPRDNAGATG